MLPPPILQSRTVVDGVTVEIWSDGYCVQRGCCLTLTDFITFPIAYKDTNFYVSQSVCGDGGVNYHSITSKTTTSFGISGTKTGHFWEVKGYIR